MAMYMIDEAFAAFKINKLQEFKSFLKVMDQNDITHEMFYNALDDHIEKINESYRLQRLKEEHIKSKLKDCPDCGEKMYCQAVNTSPANQIGGDYKSWWYCNHCQEDKELSLNTYEDELKARGINGL